MIFDFDPPALRCIACKGDIAPWNTKRAYDHDFHYDRCRQCGLVFVNPRPTVASLDRFYSQWIPEQSAGTPAVPQPSAANRAFLRRVIRDRMPAGERFLDVGAGAGGASAAAAELGLRVTALEADQRFVEGIARLPNTVAIRGLFETFEAPAGSFDLILMSHVLEHAHDPRGWITKAHRLLTPGGDLWILVPNFDGIYRRLWGAGDPYFIPPIHLNHFTPASLRRLCESGGFQTRSVRDHFALPRDVISKRLRVGWLKAPAQAMTLGIEWMLRGMTRLTRSGVFVEFSARK